MNKRIVMTKTLQVFRFKEIMNVMQRGSTKEVAMVTHPCQKENQSLNWSAEGLGRVNHLPSPPLTERASHCSQYALLAGRSSPRSVCMCVCVCVCVCVRVCVCVCVCV